MPKSKLLFVTTAALLPIALIAVAVTRSVASRQIELRFWSASFSPDSQRIAIASGGSDPNEYPRAGEYSVWDITNARQQWAIRQPHCVRTVAWSSSGKLLAVGDFSGASKLVDPATRKVLVTLPPHSALVNSIAIDGESKLIACASFDGTVTLSDDSGHEIETLVLPNEKAVSVSIASDRSLAAVGTQNGTVYIFNLNTASPAKIVTVCQAPWTSHPGVEAVVFSPDNRVLAVGCQKTFKLMEAATGNTIREITGKFANINSIAFSPDGQTLATVDSNGTLSLWNANTGQLDKQTPAHAGASFCVAFSPNGARLVTVGRNDWKAKVWDATTLGLLATLTTHKP